MLVGDYVWNMPGKSVFQANVEGRTFVFVNYGRGDVRVSTNDIQMLMQYRIEKDAFCLQIGNYYLEVSPSFNDTARVCIYDNRYVGKNPTPSTIKKPNRSVLLLIH